MVSKMFVQIEKKHNIQIKDLQNICICVKCAEDNHQHLERSGKEEDNVPEEFFNNIAPLQSNVQLINNGLSNPKV